MPKTSKEVADSLPLKPGMVVSGKYRIEEMIAAGGMGAVLLAHHEVLDQKVAIKLMRPKLAREKEAGQRFLREARAAARIESDFVARVTDVDMWEDTPFMVMEYLKGDDLDALIDSEETLTVSDAVDFVMQGLAGLHAAHNIGVIHRDLKPSNLFLVTRSDGRRRVKILDFGISKVLGDDSEGLKAGATTSTEAMLGTPRYMSPEQVSSAKDVDVRTDLWAMGLILYELLTKRYPFEGESAGAILAAILTNDVEPAHSIRRDVPKRLDKVIAKLLAKRREERFASAKHALKALAPFGSRRVQALLLDQDELDGAMADTDSHGTPSAVLDGEDDAALSARRLSALEKADNLAMAATAISTADPHTTKPSEGKTAASTETTMSVAGAPKASTSTTKVLAAAAVAAAVVGGYYLSRDDGASTAPAPTQQSQPEPERTPVEPSPEVETEPSAREPVPAATASASASSSAAAATPSVAAPPKPPPRVVPRPRPRKTPPKPTKSKDLLGNWD